MNNSDSLKQIRSRIINNTTTFGRNIPLEFTIRPLKKTDGSCNFQLVYLEYIGEQRRMNTCIITEEFLNQGCINILENSRNLLQGLYLSHAPTTLAEKLMAERMRISKEGVTFYDFDFDSDSLVFNYDGVTHHGYLKSNGEWSTPESLNISNAIDMKRNPVNWQLFSYLKNTNVYVMHLLTKESVQLTFNEHINVASGSTHFIIQEEFDRYEGMWWRPSEDNDREYHILIEEFDERMVDKFSIPDYSNGCNTEVYRYPRPGKQNAESNLKILKISLNTVTNVLTLLETLELPTSLKQLFPQYEYLTNAGWTADGKFVWIQLTDRLQNVKSTYLLPLECFRSPMNNSPRICNYAVLFSREENFQYWVPVNNNTKFLKSYQSTNKRNTKKDIFVYSSIMGTIQSGFNHLYLLNKFWRAPDVIECQDRFVLLDAETDNILPLTTGLWQVDPERIWVNEVDHLVYFLANRDNQISNHLYCVNFNNDKTSVGLVEQITNEDTSIYFKASEDWAVVITSNLFKEPQIELRNINKVKHTSFACKIKLEYVPVVNQSFNRDSSFDLSLLHYDLVDDSGMVVPLYGLLFAPKSSEPRKWPTIHYVYGGPGVRIIKNTFNRNFLFMAQTFTQFGYALLMCDGRGSTGRGIEFEGHVKNKMGIIELADQIYFLRKAAKQTGLIDLDRVGVHGSSYGGYLTIMAMLQHPDVYKCGFSCSPVVDFRLYDTAYTERYLGIPESNSEVYRQANTLTYLNRLPTDRCRLAVAHGGQDENVHFLHTAHLMEEASSIGLDIKLLFYPTSRHRIKRREHLDANLIMFMNTYLQN